MHISNEGKVGYQKEVVIREIIKPVKPNEYDDIYSNKKLGSFVEGARTYFRLFAPGAKTVTLVLFEKINAARGKQIKMKRDENCVWETSLEGKGYGLFYGFKVYNPKHPSKKI